MVALLKQSFKILKNYIMNIKLISLKKLRKNPVKMSDRIPGGIPQEINGRISEEILTCNYKYFFEIFL